jgi:hypothetical protein
VALPAAIRRNFLAPSLPVQTLRPRRARCGSHMDESGNQCIICQDAWTSSGPHQLSCLACGHLFGFACISKWLGSLPKTQGYCPQCHAKAAIKDVRTLYCPTDLASRDSSREEAIRRELARERAERAAAEAEAARATLRADQVQRKLDALTESLHQQVAAARLAPAKARRALHAAEEEEEDASTPDAPAAVCAYQVPGGKSLLFQASWAIVGSGQGQQFTLSFVHPDRPDVVQAAAKLHAGVIRDLASSADGRVVATASLDGTCKLVSSVSQNQVLSVALGARGLAVRGTDAPCSALDVQASPRGALHWRNTSSTRARAEDAW